MGQGTLTGLAQLVAEELECDWSKVTTEYPTPGQSVARKRAWGDFSTGGSRGIRTSHEYVRKGGATARIMLVQAAANEWKVPASECTAANSVITHTPSGKTTTYGKVVEAAAKLTPPADADVKLKDPKDWKIAGKSVKRLDTVDKTTGKMTYGIDVKLPGMLNAAMKDCPVFGGKLKSYDEAKVMGMKGVKKVVRVNDSTVAVVADTWWHAKTALEALPIVWDEGENAKVSSESIAKWLAEGLDNVAACFCRQPERRRQSRHRRRRQEGRGGLQLSLPEPRRDGAAERHGALHAGEVRGLDRNAKWRGRIRRGAGSFRPAGREMRGSQADPRRRFRPSRHDRLCPAGGGDRQADAGHADQAVVVARRRHAARHLPSGHAVQADRRLRRRQQSDRIAFPPVRTIHPVRGQAGGAGERQGSCRIPGPQSHRRICDRLHRAEPARRARDAQPARPARLLARRQRQSERDLSRMLHG